MALTKIPSTMLDAMTSDLSFSGTGLRIKGDMSNATGASRLAFQTSTTNGSTIVDAIPDGTGINSQFRAHNASDKANAGIGIFGITDAQLNVVATQAGTGAYVPIVFQTGGSERARIDTSGNLLVGATSAYGSEKVSIYFDNSSKIGMSFRCASSTYNWAAINFLNISGSQVGYIYPNATATSYVTSSDYRLKENIQPMQNALGVVAQLNPVTYTWKADGSDGQGFIAHELQAVVPDCVTGEKDAVDADGNPVYQGIDTSFLVATLCKAIQELKTEVDALKAAAA